MKRCVRTCAAGLLVAGTWIGGAHARADDAAMPAFRPPAVPLVTSDPYLSVWSDADHLNDDVTRHWTRRPQPLTSLIRIDGKTYCLMGKPTDIDAPPFAQKSVIVTPTRSIYTFGDGHLDVTLTFLTPTLPDDLDVLSRPLTYLTWQVKSADGQPHKVSICQAVSTLLAVNESTEPVAWKRETIDGLVALSAGAKPQYPLALAGDNTRIDWGRAYLATAKGDGVTSTTGAAGAVLGAFTGGQSLPADVTSPPTPPVEGDPTLMIAFDLGTVSADPIERTAVIAYDEIKSIQYFGEALPPFWRRNGATPSSLLRTAVKDYASLEKRCEAFDDELTADLTKAGGAKYAQIAALAYRQALAGCGLAADDHGQPLIFAKENTSNGCIATVDVIFPAAPLFAFMGPTYLKALIQPAMAYGAEEKMWPYPFAPHDLGTYPRATWQVYGMKPPDAKDFSTMMPVEESGNLILLCDAVAKLDGNADYASQYWPALTKWANYLEKYGLDPENQLCTDDFMGHLAHNANLSVKAILALAAYGDMARLRGDTATADKYIKLAKDDAAHWMQQRDPDHSRNAFDKPGSWSQKYNLVWDRLLGLNIFPPQVAQQEVAWYIKNANQYGVPLDSRTKLTKTDWCLWSATMADKQSDFEAIVNPIWEYLNQCKLRDPLTDAYKTDNSKGMTFYARPVVGGIFVKMLADPTVWKKYAARDTFKAGNWAPLVPDPTIDPIVPTAKNASVTWQYTTDKPADGWEQSGFDDHAWTSGVGGFGTKTGGAVIHTKWNTADIWLRRTFQFPAGTKAADVQLRIHHDEDADVFLNGTRIATLPGYLTQYELLPLDDTAQHAMKIGGDNVLAVHCHQTVGGQFIDAGFSTVTPVQKQGN